MNPLEEQLQIYSGHYERFKRNQGSKQKLYLPYLDNNDTNNPQETILSSEMDFRPSLSLKGTIFYLYFLQGVVISFTFTMPYIYKQLPSYDVMAIFSLALLPFAFKFLIAPFIEKYSRISYGRKKTWIVVGQITMSIIIWISSYYTQLQQAKLLAMFLFFSTLCCTFQDIALDALAIKQLKIPHIASLMQAVGQTFGLIFGSLLLLKLTSNEFALSIGKQQAITTPSTLMKIAACLILIPTILIHIIFKQSVLQSEIQMGQKSFIQVIKHYRIFLNSKSKHFRTSVLFIVWSQGINFFLAGYEYELIKAGFSRNTLNTISNMALIPISLIMFYIAPKISAFGMRKTIIINLSLYGCLIVFVYLFNPSSVICVIFVTVSMDFLNTVGFLIISILITSFPVSGVVGMYLTMLGCVSNFGRIKTIHTKFLGSFGWQKCLLAAILLQILILYKINSILSWVQAGIDDERKLYVKYMIIFLSKTKYNKVDMRCKALARYRSNEIKI